MSAQLVPENGTGFLIPISGIGISETGPSAITFTRRHLLLALAYNDTVLISMWRGGCVNSSECRLVLICVGRLNFFCNYSYTNRLINSDRHYLSRWLAASSGKRKTVRSSVYLSVYLSVLPVRNKVL